MHVLTGPQNLNTNKQNYTLVLQGILLCFFVNYYFLFSKDPCEVLTEFKSYPLLQLRPQIFGDMCRIYISICNCRVILQICFIHFLLYLFYHIGKTFDLNFLLYLLCKITLNKLLRKFVVRFIFIKFCTQTLLVLNKLDTNIRLFRKCW